ncbi:hypothetical protein K438DRAFT_1827992 [Mycena galopus ATCC 62051]|nr:hypothetical protein K438DRAFT_1827992 [Mycena galopus ATCC 62051]
MAPDDVSSLRCLQIDADQTVPLRRSVLRSNEPHVLLPGDSTGWHYGAFIDSNPAPVAIISLFIEAWPIDNGREAGADGNSTHKRAARFRRFACDPAYQGRGIGTKLLLHAISVVGSELQASPLWCHSRDETQAWYERRGLEAFGDAFFIGPGKYIRMKIEIDTV